MSSYCVTRKWFGFYSSCQQELDSMQHYNNMHDELGRQITFLGLYDSRYAFF